MCPFKQSVNTKELKVTYSQNVLKSNDVLTRGYRVQCLLCLFTCELLSLWLDQYEVIISPKLQQKYGKDFCPEIPNSIFYVSDSSLSHYIYHIFWEGQNFLQNLHLRFALCRASQIYGGDFAKFCGLLRIYELYLHTWYWHTFFQ